jgi:hypothetical protein
MGRSLGNELAGMGFKMRNGEVKMACQKKLLI